MTVPVTDADAARRRIPPQRHRDTEEKLKKNLRGH
jgi:hypothetical protein